METGNDSDDTVSALIYDPEDHAMLLVLRTDDAPCDPGCWSYFGGRVKVGEHPIPALRRELREELDLPLAENHYYYLQTLTRPDHSESTQYLVLHRKGSRELVLQEGKEMQWIPVDDIEKLNPRTDELRKALEKFRERHSSDADRKTLIHMLQLTARQS